VVESEDVPARSQVSGEGESNGIQTVDIVVVAGACRGGAMTGVHALRPLHQGAPKANIIVYISSKKNKLKN
jgi:hypothetical protein